MADKFGYMLTRTGATCLKLCRAESLNIPISSGWQGGFLGHHYKLLSPQRAHCTELHKRLSREISR